MAQVAHELVVAVLLKLGPVPTGLLSSRSGVPASICCILGRQHDGVVAGQGREEGGVRPAELGTPPPGPFL